MKTDSWEARVGDSPYEMLLARIANSVSGAVTSAKPQSKQITNFEKNKTPGLSRLLSRAERIIISAGNSACRPDAHNRQDITPPQDVVVQASSRPGHVV